MKRSTFLIALTLGALLTVTSAPAQTGPEGDATAKSLKSPCPKVAFSSVEKPQAKRRTFSAARSADLIFHVLFDPGLDEEHVVTLKVFTPKGHLYRRFDVPVAPEAEKNEHETGHTRRLPGYPYPVKVRNTKTVKAGKKEYETVDIAFPVAGSAVITSSLYGRWNVEVFLDGAADPCGKPTFFHLKE